MEPNSLQQLPVAHSHVPCIVIIKYNLQTMGKDSKKEPKGRGIPLETHQQSKAYVQQVEVSPTVIVERVQGVAGRHQNQTRPT